MRRQKVRDRDGILDMALHSERQRLESLQEQERIERAHRGSEIAERLCAKLHQVSVGAERFVKQQSMVRGRRLRNDGKPSVGPVETARVDDYAADARTVSADELRRRMQ